MGRNKNFQKWLNIYIDHTEGLTWNEIVEKNSTSKRTISKAISFYKILESASIKNLEKLKRKYQLTTEDLIELQEDFRNAFKRKLASEYSEIAAKQNQFLTKTQNIINMFESMNNITRIRLILILLIYNELSLTSLSKKLGVSKSTASRHIKALLNTNLIKIRKQQGGASRRKQYYSIVPNLLQIIRLSRTELRRIPPDKAFEARMLDLRTDKLTIRAIKNVMNEITLYYEQLEQHLKNNPLQNHQEIEEIFSLENICRFYLWMFNKKQFELFKAKYLDFLRDVLKEMEVYQDNDNEIRSETNPYFVWHMIVPLKKIYDNMFTEKKLF